MWRARSSVPRIADRPAHLPGEFLRDFFAIRLECVAEAAEDCRSLGHGYRAPAALRQARVLERGLYLGGTSQRALDEDAAVDRGNGALDGHGGKGFRQVGEILPASLK
jgi:hypothetical protein